MIPSWEGWPTKAKEELSPHEVRLTPLDTKPVFLCLEDFCFLYILDFCYLVSLLGQALTNWVCVYLTYLKSQILQIVGLDYFLTSMLTNMLLQLLECVMQLHEIRHTCTLQQSVCQICKTNNMTFFISCFMPSSSEIKSYYSF